MSLLQIFFRVLSTSHPEPPTDKEIRDQRLNAALKIKEYMDTKYTPSLEDASPSIPVRDAPRLARD